MFCSLLRCGCLCAVQDTACLTTLVVLCLPPNSCLEPTQSTFSCAETAVLSPALGVTKQSPYPLLWEHEVKGTVTWGQRHSRIWQTPLHLLTSVTSHPYKPPPLAPCFRQGHYATQLYHPQNSSSRVTASTQGPLQRKSCLVTEAKKLLN